MDTTFNPGSGTTGQSGSVYALEFLPNGRILVGGAFNSYNGITRPGLARVMADGTFDNTFDPGPGLGTSNYPLAVTPEGKIFIGCSLFLSGTLTNATLARLNANVGIDPSFIPSASSGSTVGNVGALTLQADGRILAGQSITSGQQIPPVGIARFASNGSIDPTFSVPGLHNAKASRIMLLDNGDLIVAGGQFHDGRTYRSGIARLRAFSAPTITSGAATAFVEGTPGAFLVAATGVPAVTFSIVGGALPAWAKLNSSTGTITGTPPNGAAAPAPVVIQANNGVGTPATQTLTISLIARPSVTISPLSANVSAGSSLTLSAQGQGAPALAYQWQKNGVDLLRATTATLTLTDFQPADAGIYAVTVSNLAGSTISEAAVVGMVSSAKVAGS
ncbi:MAG: immunoglobulin domain-containing protein, partial [Opitutaceae bacterium]